MVSEFVSWPLSWDLNWSFVCENAIYTIVSVLLNIIRWLWKFTLPRVVFLDHRLIFPMETSEISAFLLMKCENSKRSLPEVFFHLFTHSVNLWKTLCGVLWGACEIRFLLLGFHLVTGIQQIQQRNPCRCFQGEPGYTCSLTSVGHWARLSRGCGDGTALVNEPQDGRGEGHAPAESRPQPIGWLSSVP